MTEQHLTNQPQKPTSHWVDGFVLLVVILTAITWAVGIVQPGKTPPVQVAFVDGFPGELSQWERRGAEDTIGLSDDGVVVQRRTEQQPYATRKFDLPADLKDKNYFLDVEGLVHNTTVEFETKTLPGDGIQMGVLMAWFHSEDGEIIQYRTVHDLEIDKEIHEARRSIEIPDGATAVSIAFGTRDSLEGYKLLEAKAWLVEIGAISQYIFYALLGVWALVLLTSLCWILHYSPLTHGLLIIAMLGAIAVGVLLPESVTFNFLSKINVLISDAPYGSGAQKYMPLLFKFGHFFFFAAAAFFLFYKRMDLRIKGFMLLLLLIALALGTEGLQLQLPDRTTRASDILIDVVGILTGIGAAYLLHKLTKPKPLSVSSVEIEL